MQGFQMSAGFFHQFSNIVSRGAGKPATFALACGLILLWAISGPFFGFSETWQLVVNTATTIVTFLMVFVVQHTQNRDGEAVQAKLDELILALKRADNRLIGAEDLTGHELHKLRRMIAERVARDKDAIEEIDRRTAAGRSQ
jgi:low affinity Fe/Cu permease